MQRIYCPQCEAENFEEAVVCSLCGHQLQGREPNVTGASHTARKRQSRKLYVVALGIVLLSGAGFIVVTNLVRSQQALKVSAVPSEAVSALPDRESASSAPAVGLFGFFKPKEVIDQAKYERLYRAGKAITAATQIGVNRNDFHRLLLDLNTELEIALDKVTADPFDPASLKSKMVGLYIYAKTGYAESESFWRMVPSTEDGKYFGEKLPVLDLALAEDIRKRYGVEFVEGKVQYTGETFYGFPLELPQLIWSKCSAYIAEAEAIYLGTQP